MPRRRRFNCRFRLAHALLWCARVAVAPQIFKLLHYDGLFVGASSALNVAAAVEMARQLGPGKNIVTILADGAYRYQSRLFSKKWLESKGLYTAVPEDLRSYVSLP